MKKKFIKLSERNMELRSLMSAIADKAKAEKRSLTKEEAEQYEQYRNEHNANMMEIQDIVSTEQYRKAHGAERSGLMQLLRDARTKEGHMVELPACSEMLRTAISAGSEGSDVIETEFKGLLEPLYAQSALAKLGVRFYPGLPQGNIHVPIMGKGTVGWATEMGNSSDGAQTFTSVELTPKRLTAYVDISKQLLNQDTIGVEEAVRRDIVKAISDKLEATIFGKAAGSATQPKGMFWDASLSTPAVRTLEDGTDFAKVCGIEAGVEAANYTNVKYLLSPNAKADLRAMAKSSKNTQLVYEGGEIDGTPAITTSNVGINGAYIYGDFSNLLVASWGNIEITVDEYTQATKGCVRLVVNAYFDAKVAREDAFAYARTRTIS